MTTKWIMLLAACGGLAGAAVRAHAEPPAAPPPDLRAQANERLSAGLAFYQAQDYERAIEEFRAGFALEPRREFLFSLGQAERLSGDCASAILYYQAFLRARPPAEQASAAREQIQICHLLLATEKPKRRALPRRRFQTDRDEPPPARSRPSPRPRGEGRVGGRTERPPWYTDVTGDLLLGGGMVALAVAGGLWASSASLANSAASATTYPQYAGLIERARNRRTFALAAGAAGGALIGASIWRFRWGRSGGRAEVAIVPAPDEIAVAVGGRF